MDNIFASFAKKVTKKVEEEERGMDPLAQYRITGINKLSKARPEMSDIKVAVAETLLHRARRQ